MLKIHFSCVYKTKRLYLEWKMKITITNARLEILIRNGEMKQEGIFIPFHTGIFNGRRNKTETLNPEEGTQTQKGYIFHFIQVHF